MYVQEESHINPFTMVVMLYVCPCEVYARQRLQQSRLIVTQRGRCSDRTMNGPDLSTLGA